jgi:hypothetical protein
MKKRILFFTSFTLLIIAICVINIFQNEDFWDISIGNIISVVIAVVVAYFFVQSKNDERKRKEKMEDIINKIQLFINSVQAYTVESPRDELNIKMQHRSVSNKLAMLGEYKKNMGIDEEYIYIFDKFTSYKDMIGNHITDYKYIKDSRIDLQRDLALIDDKLDMMKLKLYSKE